MRACAFDTLSCRCEMLPVYLRLNIKNRENYIGEYSGYRSEGGVCVCIYGRRNLSKELFL